MNSPTAVRLWIYCLTKSLFTQKPKKTSLVERDDVGGSLLLHREVLLDS